MNRSEALLVSGYDDCCEVEVVERWEDVFPAS